MRMATYKRKIFYLGGFDPRGARHYHQLCREAAAPYGAEVSARQGEQWRITREGCETDYHFLAWDDIVRRAWIRKPLVLVWQSLRMYAAYALHFRWRDIWRLPRAPIVTLAYPLALMLLGPLLLFGLASLLLPWYVALALALGLSVLLLHRTKALWLLRFFVFNYRVARHIDPALDARLDAFAATVRASYEEGYDEVLLVAFSNGSILTVSLLDRLGALPPHVRVLTLGQCIPLISHLDCAPRFREELGRVAAMDFYWCDIGFPPDGACYARIDPFLPHYPQHRAQVVTRSPRFFQYYAPERYQALRRNKYQLHFAYLATGDTLSPLDFIALATAPRALPESIEQNP